MRGEFQRWAREFPKAVADGNEAFAGSDVARFVTTDLPAAVSSALPSPRERYVVSGSAGRGQWTFTPWIAVLDPSVTVSVQEGYYVVYLLSADGSQLFLSLNQGCTLLNNTLGKQRARDELHRRASLMRSRISSSQRRILKAEVSLGVRLWRGQLYEAGDIASVAYSTNSLPPEEILRSDLAEAVALYSTLSQEGGWEPDDKIVIDAERDTGIVGDLVHAKRYKRHWSIERIASHAKAVKRAQGCRCRGCDVQLNEVYGDAALGLIEAHHLTPISSLKEGEVASFDPNKDFAVLCPNCHAVIHLMDDTSNVEGLRRMLIKAKRS